MTDYNVNGAGGSGVPTTRTVAGLPLSADISTPSLKTALSLGAVTATGATAAAARSAVSAAYNPGSPTIDANHLYVWRCDDAAGAGSIAEASGGPALALTGSTWVQGDGALYPGGACAFLAPGAAVADRAKSPTTLTLPSGSITIEINFMMSALILTVGGSSLTELALFARVGAARYVTIRLSSSGGGVYAASVLDGGSANTSTTALPLSRLSFDVPHHLMAVAVPGTSLSLYCDGALVSSVALPAGSYAGSDVWASIGDASDNQAPLGRFGELRISNVARDAAYARAAYATLRGRS